MKRLFFTLAVLIAVLSVNSCSIVMSTASYSRMNVTPIAEVMADVEVMPTRITYTYVPTLTVRKGGYDNILSTAVREALNLHGRADVLVGMETQVTYKCGRIKSITVSGYPGKYSNFRTPSEAIIISHYESANHQERKPLKFKLK